MHGANANDILAAIGPPCPVALIPELLAPPMGWAIERWAYWRPTRGSESTDSQVDSRLTAHRRSGACRAIAVKSLSPVSNSACAAMHV